MLSQVTGEVQVRVEAIGHQLGTNILAGESGPRPRHACLPVWHEMAGVG